MGRFVDLTGQRFGRLIAIKRTDDYISPSNKPSVMWECRCDCGNKCVVSSSSLRTGHTISCGCYFIEVAREKGKNSKKYNLYNLDNDYGICYAHNTGEEILFDLEDYNKIKQYCWSVYERKNAVYKIVSTRIEGKNIPLSHYILGYSKEEKEDNIVIDHINRNTLDNRKCNLRKCTQQENIFNSCRNHNSLGVKGVGRYSSGNYYANITKDGKKYNLGTFGTLKEAADAYDAKAKELYGEFAYLNNYLEDSTDRISSECGYN